MNSNNLLNFFEDPQYMACEPQGVLGPPFENDLKGKTHAPSQITTVSKLMKDLIQALHQKHFLTESGLDPAAS